MPELWPYAPRPGHADALEWFTSVLSGRGGEQRQALRSLPRRFVSGSWPLDGQDLTDALAALRRGSLGDWTLSVWALRDGLGTVPTATARLAGAPQVSLGPRQGFGEVAAEFRVATASVTPAELPTHRGAPVVDDPCLIAEPLGASVELLSVPVDPGVGPAADEAIETFVRERHTLRFADATFAAQEARRAMLFALEGRRRAFWMAPRGPRIALADAASGTTVDIAAAAAVADYAGRSIHLQGAAAGLFREITGASDLGGGVHRLTLAESLGETVPATARAGWAVLVRQDSDRVEMVHKGPLMRTGMVVVEVPA